MTLLTRESKFYATSRSVGVLNIYLHLELGVGLRGKLKLPNICHAKYRKKNYENNGLFSITGQLLIGCQEANLTIGLMDLRIRLAHRFRDILLHFTTIYFEKNILFKKWSIL